MRKVSYIIISNKGNEIYNTDNFQMAQACVLGNPGATLHTYYEEYNAEPESAERRKARLDRIAKVYEKFGIRG